MERVLDLQDTCTGRGVSPPRTAVQGAFTDDGDTNAALSRRFLFVAVSPCVRGASKHLHVTNGFPCGLETEAVVDAPIAPSSSARCPNCVSRGSALTGTEDQSG
jgi:hypothetical protein